MNPSASRSSISLRYASSVAVLLFSLFSFGTVVPASTVAAAPAPTEWVSVRKCRNTTRTLRFSRTQPARKYLADFSFLSLLTRHRELICTFYRLMSTTFLQIEMPIRLIKPTATPLPDGAFFPRSLA